MLRYLGKGVWTCPLGAPAADGEDPITGRVVALLVVAGKVARRRPRSAVAVLALLLLAAGAGF